MRIKLTDRFVKSATTEGRKPPIFVERRQVRRSGPRDRPQETQPSCSVRRSVGQLRRNLRDVLALIAGAVEFVGARLARAVALGQGAGAVRRAAGDLVHIGQSREGIGQADDDHALVQQGRVERGDRRLLATMLSGGTGEHAADLPTSAPFIQRPPVWSRKLRIWAHILPKRVGVPKMMASYVASSSTLQMGAGWSSFMPDFLATSSGTSSGTRLMMTSVLGTARAPSATASAIFST